MLNYLGENVTDRAVAESHKEEYLQLQQAIATSGVDGFVSVKLTQFGLGSDGEGALRRLESVAENAERLHQLLWIDMEGSNFTDWTLNVYTDIQARHQGVGLALQAYMRRSENDLKMLLDNNARIRLVKGAYKEQPAVVFPTRREISQNFSSLMHSLFDQGDNFAIATHDSKLVEEAERIADSRHVNFRFEMLKGIRNELKEELVKSGYKLSEYLPYGEEWYAYSRRRLTEHPSNVLLLVRSLF